MNNNQSDKLNLSSLLDQYDYKINKIEEKKEREKSEREIFTEKFISLRDQKIKPILECLKEEIEKRGHNVRIEIVEPGWDSYKKIAIEPSITFNLSLKQTLDNIDEYCDSRELPHISFKCDSWKKMVWVHESTIGQGHGGHAGSRGKFSFDSLTEDVINREFMGWFKDLVE